MKNNRFRLFIAFTLFVFLPFNVNAEEELKNTSYTASIKKIEDYVCEELKGHNLVIGGQAYNKLIVYDETDDKEYWIDFLKKGVCEEYKEDSFSKDYTPTEYYWNENKLYLQTYGSNVINIITKTLDKEIEFNSHYAEKKEDGFYHVENPVLENLSKYYEGYWFELATEEYDENISYYEIVKNKYTIDNFDGYFEEAIIVQLDETNYETNKYYVLAKPEKEELIVEFKTDNFIVPKDKTELDSDLSLTKFDFMYHIEFNNDDYYVFQDNNQTSPILAIFDENGNYQTFGLETLLAKEIFEIDDKEYLSLLRAKGNNNNLVILDKGLNSLVSYDVSEFGDALTFIGYEENTFYFLADPFEGKILEIKIYSSVIEDKYKVIFDANEGKFENNNTTLVIDEWKNEYENDLEKPTRDGYEFVGFFNEKTDGTSLEKYLAEAGIDQNMTFYAQWKKIDNSSVNNEVNPQTFDGIVSSILVSIISLISLIGLVGVTVYLNKIRA